MKFTVEESFHHQGHDGMGRAGRLHRMLVDPGFVIHGLIGQGQHHNGQGMVGPSRWSEFFAVRWILAFLPSI